MTRPLDYWILWLVVVALIGSNAWTALKFAELRSEAAEALVELSNILVAEPSTTTVTLKDRLITFNAVMSPSETILVPISTVVPIDTVVNAPVTLPIVGTIQVKVPVKTNVPVNLSVAVQLKNGIPIQGTMALDSAAIEVPLDYTPLRELLERLRTVLGGIGS